MARYYVEKDGRWNVFSSIVDDFLYSDFMGFDELKALVIGEVVINKLNELETLQTERPRLNTMSYEDVMEIIREVHADEIEDTPQTEQTEPTTEDCSMVDCEYYKNPDYQRCMECKRKQADCSWK